MKILKFGGASVKNPDTVKKLSDILKKYSDENTLVVISAMDKMTNAFEKLTYYYFHRNEKIAEQFDFIKNYHFNILNGLFEDKNDIIYNEIDKLFSSLQNHLKKSSSQNYDFEYDQIVSYGELLSTKIISRFLNSIGIKNLWFDVREILKTDTTYREAKINWGETEKLCKKNLLKHFNSSNKLIITQGFIGESFDNHTTTLGREGSDYTAAVFANIFDVNELIVWKDVPGLLNADPKYFEDTKKIDFISFKEASELTYYGAKIIHPKTIKPLQNKNIPILIKPFYTPEEKGSLISDKKNQNNNIPIFIIKRNQILVSLSPKDFSFIANKHLSEIFNFFNDNNLKINLLQISAISISVCLDDEDEDEKTLKKIIKLLNEKFNIRYNKGLEIITIRHYNNESLKKILRNKEILLEQKSRATIQILAKQNLEI
ncbi:MAG: aspartate kinase [Bacteroidales bacterium]|nr:aspartate kinase [Bacteroidales bacterium]